MTSGSKSNAQCFYPTEHTKYFLKKVMKLSIKRAIAQHITRMEEGMAECLINISKIPTFVEECQKDIAKAKKEKGENEKAIIETNQKQIDQHEHDYKANQNMYRTMDEIVGHMIDEYFPTKFDKVLFYILK